MEAGGLRIALIHDHRQGYVDKSYKGGHDVVVRGHTHRARIGYDEGVLVVNPDEVCGYVTGWSTVAFLDAERGTSWLSDLY